MLRAILFILPFGLLTFCSPNRSIMESTDNTNSAVINVSQPAPEAVVPKMTVAELMQRVATAPKDSFLFPCTLNAYADADRESLKKLRQVWLSKENDGRYKLSSATDCVCPELCVLKVEDSSKIPPNTFSLIVINRPDKYIWAARDIDLSHAELGWAATVPYIYYLGPDGKRNGKACSVEPADGAYTMKCP